MVKRVAFLQMDSDESAPDANLSAAHEGLRRAVDVGADVFALPELWHSGYDLAAALSSGRNWSETIDWCRDRSTEHPELTFLAGSLLAPEGDGFANQALILRGGEIRSRFEKVHLFGPLQEDRHLVAGDKRPQVTRVDDLSIGQVICYDLRFPELFRDLALDQVELVHVPAQWPKARTAHWRTLLVARAIETQSYVLGVNRTGSYRGGKVDFFGNSLLVGPTGEILIDAGSEPGFHWADIEPWEVQNWRQKFPYLDDRRRDLYGGRE